MARNSSSGSLKGQEAAASGGRMQQQQQQLVRAGKQGGARAGYGGNSGTRLEGMPSKITITEQAILFEVSGQRVLQWTGCSELAQQGCAR